MSKAERKRELIMRIAKEPWQHSLGSLAQSTGVDETTISRDIKELEANGFSFIKDDSGRLYLGHSGSLLHEKVKDPAIRQLEVARYIAAAKAGRSYGEIINRFKNSDGQDLSDRTLDRTIKELKQKGLIIQSGDRYSINSEKVVTKLYLEEGERTLLLEALALAEGSFPLPEEAKSVAAMIKRLVIEGEPRQPVVYVHGRSPVHDHAVNSLCHQLESAAKRRTRQWLLYRKANEPARERNINPLGLVYYWVLDKWYLVATEDKQPELVKTYAVDGILLCEDTSESFDPPEDFVLREHFKYSWGIYQGDQPTRVKVRFPDYFSVPQRVKEELCHRETCELENTEDGLIMTDVVKGLEEFAVWLRGFGLGVEVLEPAGLREKVIEELCKTLNNYEGSQKHG